MESPAAPNFLFLFLLSVLIFCSTATGVTSPVTVTAAPGPPIITVPSATPLTVTPPPPATVSPPVATNNPPPAVGPPAATGQSSWCVAKTGAPSANVQTALDYACGAGADCSAIQPGESCFNPNTLQGHASYAFNSYYLKSRGQSGSCDFSGVATVTGTNPSSGSCNYPALSTSTSPPTTTTPITPTTPTTTPMTPMTPTTPTTPTTTPMTPMTPMTPSTTTPMTPPMTPMTPGTPSSTGGLAAPPNAFNGNNPPLGGDTGFGGNPQTSSSNSVSIPSSLQQSIIIGCVILVASITTGVIGFDI